MATITTINIATDTPASAATKTNDNFTSLETDVDANTAKTGITGSQASEITANTAKVSADGSINTHSDVDITSVQGGDKLVFNSSTGMWENEPGTGLKITILNDTKSSGTGGGTPVATTWTNRDLNTEVYDGIGVTLAANKFTLPAGTYLIEATTPFYDCATSATRLYDVTNTTAIVQGSSVYSNTSNGSANSNICAIVTPTVDTQYSIDYYAGSAVSNGLGAAITTGSSNVFTIVKITEII